MKIQEAISHYNYGIKCDIFSEPATSYAKLSVEALEKQIPKKPAFDKNGYLVCGNCGSYDGIRTETNFTEGYCWECGQKIDTAHPTEKGGVQE